MNERITILNMKIQELKELRRQIVPDAITVDFMNSLSDVSKEKLKDYNAQISLLAKERDNLNWQLKTDDEKAEIRKDHLAITKKYSDGTDSGKVKYLELYIKLLEILKRLIDMDKKLEDIYTYLDASDFQNTIPVEFLNELEKYNDLKELVNRIKNLLNATK